jgi:hypothetical protein
MPGNFTSLENVSNLVTLSQTVNTASGMVLGNLMVLVSLVVTYAVANRVGSERALTVSSFITCIMAILLRLMNFVSDWVLIVTIILAALLATINIIQNMN